MKKRKLYIVIVILQGLTILVSAVNVIYCLIIGKFTLFYGSCVGTLFLSLNRYFKDGNIFELIFLFSMLIIISVSYVLASKTLLNPTNRSSGYLGLYVMLTIFLMVTPCLAANVELFDLVDQSITAINFLMSSVLSFAYQLVVLYKQAEQRKYVAEHPINREDYFTNFQKHAKSYKQITRTAKGTPVIAIGVFLVSLYYKYMGKGFDLSPTDEKLILLIISFHILYLVLFAVMIYLFVIINKECKLYAKLDCEPLPNPNYVRNLNIMQIVSMVFHVIAYFILVLT